MSSAAQTTENVNQLQHAFARLKLAQYEYMRAEQDYDAALKAVAPHIFAMSIDDDLERKFKEILSN